MVHSYILTSRLNIPKLQNRDATTPGFERLPSKESAIREASQTNSAEENGTTKVVKEVCFNCWSAGRGKKCMLHNMDKVSECPQCTDLTIKVEVVVTSTSPPFCPLLQKQDGNPIKISGESQLMCQNWDLSVLRRRYRSEEIQEIFAKSASSLR